MMRHLTAAAILAACSTVASAQPSLVALGVGTPEIAANGMGAVGQFYDAAQNKNVIYRYFRGVGAQATGCWQNFGQPHGSDDLSAIMFEKYNTENWGGLGTNMSMTYRWTQGTGMVNLGQNPGGNPCDQMVNYPSDLSGDGRWVCGSNYTSGCTIFRAWVYDSQTATFTTLPVSVSAPPINALALNTRADAINADGTVVIGYDENYNATFTSTPRRACVWTRLGTTWTQTILDPGGDDSQSGEAYGVNSLGTIIVGRLSTQTMQSTFGTTVRRPIKWTRSGNSWTPSILSAGGTASMLATKVSPDGNTVLGYDGGVPFVWRPTINGGTPMALQDYLIQQGHPMSNITIGTLLGLPRLSMSADGNVIATQILDNRSPCLLSGNAVAIYLNGTSCEPARVNFSPVSQGVTGPSSLEIVLNCVASGSWPLDYQWQKETAPGVWTDIVENGCSTNNPAQYDYKGVVTGQLRIGYLSGEWLGNYRCRVLNECGNVVSAVAAITQAAPPCYANCDTSTGNPVLTANDFQCFIDQFVAGTSYANCDGSTGSPVLTGNDFQCFVDAFAAGCR